ncbi:helix-turn-helix transcriptional regulator [Luteimicrobium album]|nr:helix-turn-helix transcriptional regulator [Luteimicrobium album]
MRVKDPGAIRRARLRAGYTQYDLAALARCTQAAISALETGAMRGCSQDLGSTIAKYLDRDVEDLFEAHVGSRAHRVTNAAGSVRQVAV